MITNNKDDNRYSYLLNYNISYIYHNPLFNSTSEVQWMFCVFLYLVSPIHFSFLFWVRRVSITSSASVTHTYAPTNMPNGFNFVDRTGAFYISGERMQDMWEEWRRRTQHTRTRTEESTTTTENDFVAESLITRARRRSSSPRWRPGRRWGTRGGNICRLC